MKHYDYQNSLIGKKQLRQILGWSFTNYDSMQTCILADELKYIGFKYATQAGISISLEDLRVPFNKNLMIKKSNKNIINSEKIYLKGKITDVERYQNIIYTWNITSESLKNQVVKYFQQYDPLNSVYIMAFSGARGNLAQVRQLVGMRGLMSDPSGEIMNLPIKKNFREGLTITDYLMSGYGARKGIVDTALKTANSGYLTRRLIDVAQDIFIRERNCLTEHTFLISDIEKIADKIIGRVLAKSIVDKNSLLIIAHKNTQITLPLINLLIQKKISNLYIRSPLTCKLYRAICQQCYGWDLATENLIDIGEAIGILAGQSIGEPGTQLTMRTFHTGGIFTSKMRERIIGNTTGIIKFSNSLKTVLLRTNRGDNVLVTKNSGTLIIIPKLKTENIQKIDVARNTILFPKHNQYVQKNIIIGEIINMNRQLKKEIKPIIATSSGEIIVPKLKMAINSLNTNKLLWVLSGNLYNSPINSYINFYPDYKLNKNSFIFRTKIISNYCGKIFYFNNSKTLYKRRILTNNKVYSFTNCKFFKLVSKIGNAQHVIKFENFHYLTYTRLKNKKIYLKTTRKNQFAHLLLNSYRTNTGGICNYDWRILTYNNNPNLKINFYNNLSKFTPIIYRTLLWLEEETYIVNCEPIIILAKHGDFVSKNFEITPGCFSKTSGFVVINQDNNIVKTVTIKSGAVYEGANFDTQKQKIYFPGEIIYSSIEIVTPSVCTYIKHKNKEQLLISSINMYEIPYKLHNKNYFNGTNAHNKFFDFQTDLQLLYHSNQSIKSTNSISLALSNISLRSSHFLNDNFSVKLEPNKNKILFTIFNKLNFNKYIVPKLKYKNLESCLLFQINQFIDKYTTLLYLESLTLNFLEIVKIKINQSKIKQILLISNNHCSIVKKHIIQNKQVNDFIMNSTKTTHVGKIIIENNNHFTIQKGRPYFFPNCKPTIFAQQDNLKYKFLPNSRKEKKINTKKNIFLNQFTRLKISVETNINYYLQTYENYKFNFIETKLPLKFKLSLMFLKRNGKLYSCLIPRFLTQYRISNNKNIINNAFFKNQNKEIFKISRTLLIRITNSQSNHFNLPQLALIKFLEYPLTKTNKSIGMYSITEDLFEEESNSVFCQNNQFLEDGQTIGLLNLEKEITGDIVQGLPRIEEILEARKKKQLIKRIPTNQKKNLLTQKNSLNHDFEFCRIGSPINENEKINPHKLLKVYFNYYGFLQPLYSDSQNLIRYARLINNFESSFKSFKKVQTFILDSVQDVYKSQGVNINDKHIEIIIKQMTTKVLVTEEGDTPLLKREIIDLYHIEYINKIIMKENKQKAYYLPLLFGITRAALNNPSFISAASFQETTKVLTKAAIEGRIDWLRGLKENIIIGHLIPAGTGFRTYTKSFKK